MRYRPETVACGSVFGPSPPHASESVGLPARAANPTDSHTTEIVLTNRADEILAQSGVIASETVRRIVVPDALVDTGATRLSLPRTLIRQLGLTPVGTTQSFTANGTVERTVYSEVRFTVLGRSGSLEVTDLPDEAPVLVGHMVMELLDLCVDVTRGLTYNPAHDGKWIEEQLASGP